MIFAPLAQLEERPICVRRVSGSTPERSFSHTVASIASGSGPVEGPEWFDPTTPPSVFTAHRAPGSTEFNQGENATVNLADILSHVDFEPASTPLPRWRAPELLETLWLMAWLVFLMFVCVEEL